MSQVANRPQNANDLEDGYAEETVSFVMKVSHAAVFFNWLQLHTSFYKKFRISTREGDSETYVCVCARAPPAGRQFPASNSKTCGCKAQVVFQHSPVYKHHPVEPLNVMEHGGSTVKISWTWAHNHHPSSSSNIYWSKLPQTTKNFLLVVLSSSGTDFLGKKNEYPWNDHMPQEFDKVRWLVIRSIRDKIFWDISARHGEVETSLRKWAVEMSASGMAEFKHEPQAGAPAGSAERTWSFFYMSRMAMNRLFGLSQGVYFHSVQSTCHGLHKNDPLFLYTLLCHDKESNKHYAAAYFLTNTPTQPVIASFLRKVRDNARLTPEEVFFDYKEAEGNAISEVWPRVKPRSCFWHINATFKGLRITEPRGKLAEKKTAAPRATQYLSALMRVVSLEQRRGMMQAIVSQNKDYHDIFRHMESKYTGLFAHNFEASSKLGTSPEKLLRLWHPEHRVPGQKGQRPDLLLFRLLKMNEPRYRMSRTQGGTARKNDPKEQSAWAQVSRMAEKEVFDKMLSGSESIFVVKSFARAGDTHAVKIHTKTSKHAACSCKSWMASQSWCKHIFLASRWHDKATAVRMLEQTTAKKSQKASPQKAQGGVAQAAANPAPKPAAKAKPAAKSNALPQSVPPAHPHRYPVLPDIRLSEKSGAALPPNQSKSSKYAAYNGVGGGAADPRLSTFAAAQASGPQLQNGLRQATGFPAIAPPPPNQTLANNGSVEPGMGVKGETQSVNAPAVDERSLQKLQEFDAWCGGIEKEFMDGDLSIKCGVMKILADMEKRIYKSEEYKRQKLANGSR